MREKIVLDVTYSINDTPLDKRETTTDLGITFSSLSFTNHINHKKSSALKSLGFITRHATDFKNPLTFKLLYSSLIVSYAFQIWNPNPIELHQIA